MLINGRDPGDYSSTVLTPMLGGESNAITSGEAMVRALAYLVICSNESVARLIRALAA